MSKYFVLRKLFSVVALALLGLLAGSGLSPTQPMASADSSTLPTPRAGMEWQMTFSDEFNGTSVDTSKWTGGYANLQWCGGGSCPAQYTGLSVTNGVLSLQPRVTSNFSTAYENRAMMHTGGLNASSAKFSQRYGYFEVRAKFPHNDSGEGDGLWWSFWALPLGKTDNTHEGPPGYQHEEVDILESVLGTYNKHYTYLNLHDISLGEHSVKYPATSDGDLSQGYHTYGLYWRNDGSAHGSMQVYFDGIAQGSPIVLDSPNYWDNGIYLILQIIPCPLNNNPFGGGNACTSLTSNNNPFLVDYVRAYKEAPATPTPPAAPSALLASAASQTQVNLSWQDNSSNESGFKIERSPNGANSWTQIATVGANVKTYNNAGLTCNTPYYYRVRAYNAAGNSSYSNTANATTSACSSNPNLLANHDFEADTAAWSFYTNGTGSWTATSPAYQGAKAAKVTLTTVGSNMQLYQYNLSLQPYTQYRLRFYAYSSSGHDVKVELLQHVSPYTNYGLNQVCNLSTGWQLCDLVFTTSGFASPVSDARFRFTFNGYASNGDVYWIDDAELYVNSGPTPTPVPPTPTPTPVPPTPTPTPSGGTSILANHDFEAGAASWSFYTNGTGSWTATSPAYQGAKAAKLTLTTVSDNVQLYQYNLSLQPYTQYRLRFAAYSSSGHDMRIVLQKHDSPYTLYGLDQVVNLSSGWQVFDILFTTSGFSAPVSDARFRFYFNGYASNGDVYWIDDVELYVN